MQAAPFLPIREKKRIQLEVLAFERPGNGLQAGLLPAAAGFAVLKDLVAADHAGVVHLEFAPLIGGPEHEGRVAIASPGDGDGARGRLVFDEAVLRKNGGRIGFGDGTCHDADDAVGVVQKRGLGSRIKLRGVDRGVRQARLGWLLRGGAYARCEGGRSDREKEQVFPVGHRSAEHTSELQSPLNISYAVFCLKKKKKKPKKKFTTVTNLKKKKIKN